ncbi:hypothetical protein DBR11_23820 [Pedobacter sp. HMWF019]|nr:hypothetical protein DBR11_23820 [Pedobacter sp. HMWF019]
MPNIRSKYLPTSIPRLPKLFLYGGDAREKIENVRWEYHHYTPHSSLNDLTPKEFVNLQFKTSKI